MLSISYRFSFLLIVCFFSTYINATLFTKSNYSDSLQLDSMLIEPIMTTDSVLYWRYQFNENSICNHPLEVQFEPKFQGVFVHDIKYTPQNEAVFFYTSVNTIPDSLAINRYVKSLADIHQQYILANPQKVKLNWDDIPEPHKLLERGFMRRIDAQEELKKSNKNIGENASRALIVKKQTVSPWRFSGVEYLQLQQTGQFNWQTGGESKLVFLNDLRLKLNYTNKKVEWESYGISKMGILFNDDKEVEINNDQLELNTKYGYKAAKKWFYSVNANLKTQLFYDSNKHDDGTVTYNSGFLSPGYFTAGIGMDYKPHANLSILLAPITSKLTFVLDTININPLEYNIKPGNRVIRQVGFNIVANYKIPFSNLTSLANRVEIFKDYIEKYNSWYFYMENIFDMRINKYLVLRVDFQWKYSEIESNKIQFLENVLIGFTYNF